MLSNKTPRDPRSTGYGETVPHLVYLACAAAVDGGMSEEDPRECAKPVEPAAQAPPEKTSDYYRVAEDLPVRFNNPAWFRGYR